MYRTHRDAIRKKCGQKCLPYPGTVYRTVKLQKSEVNQCFESGFYRVYVSGNETEIKIRIRVKDIS
jgi:hypothetical protein